MEEYLNQISDVSKSSSSNVTSTRPFTAVKPSTTCSALQLDRDLIAGAFADVWRKMCVQTAELIYTSLASGKKIQELVEEYDDRDKLDERLKQMTAKELLLRDMAYFEMKWCESTSYASYTSCYIL